MPWLGLDWRFLGNLHQLKIKDRPQKDWILYSRSLRQEKGKFDNK